MWSSPLTWTKWSKFPPGLSTSNLSYLEVFPACQQNLHLGSPSQIMLPSCLKSRCYISGPRNTQIPLLGIQGSCSFANSSLTPVFLFHTQKPYCTFTVPTSHHAFPTSLHSLTLHPRFLLSKSLSLLCHMLASLSWLPAEMGTFSSECQQPLFLFL